MELNCLQRKCMPCQVVWRETSQQHFPGVTNGGGYDDVNRAKCTECKAVTLSNAIKHNWRNTDARRVMLKYKVRDRNNKWGIHHWIRRWFTLLGDTL